MGTLQQTLDRPGVSIRYSDSAAPGPAIVFLHGAGADHVMFMEQAAALSAAGWRVILPDLRGHGQSQPNTEPLSAELLIDDVKELIAATGVHSPVLVGHSMGGNIAQALVKGNPEFFRALVVLDSTWNSGPLSALERNLLRWSAPILKLIPAKSLPKLMANASAVTDFARADAIRAFKQVSKHQFLQIWRATTEFVSPDRSYRTPIPLLLVRGEKDSTGNIAKAMPAWALAENVGEHVIDDAGHIVTQDAPVATTRVIMDFVEGL